MTLLLAVFGLLFISALVSLFDPRGRLGLAGALVAGAVGGFAAVQTLVSNTIQMHTWAWSAPYAAFSIGLDPLSAWFLLPLFVVTPLAAVYGRAYLAKEGHAGRWHFFFFNLLTLFLALVFTARNAVLFLTAWEGMTLVSFALVVGNGKNREAAKAGWTYLAVSHVAVALLTALFALLSGGKVFEFADFAALAQTASPALKNTVFAAALAGFGVKAGLVPLHFWLPEAHSEAPSHVSAVMSGLLVKTGFYGFLRVLTFLGAPVPVWGYVLVGVGLVTALYGVLQALMQKDLKRLLAFSTVENLGLMFLGVGLGILGQVTGHTFMQAAGYGAALIHMLNHALFKSLLFMGAGSVLAATHTRLIAGLVAMLCAKAFGLVFLGSARPAAQSVVEVPWAMRLPMLVLAGLCLMLALDAGIWLPILYAPLAGLGLGEDQLASLAGRVQLAGAVNLGLAILVSALVLLRLWLLRNRAVHSAGTWDCGYARPEASMQYTGSSFVEPVAVFFRPLLFKAGRIRNIVPLFPQPTKGLFEPHDRLVEELFRPLKVILRRVSEALKWIQHGRVHLYVLYITVTLILLLVYFAFQSGW